MRGRRACPPRLALRSGRAVVVVHTDRLCWLESAGNSVRLHTGESSVLVRTTLRDLLATLDPERFVRIHRCTVVNLDHVDRVELDGGGRTVVVTEDGSRLAVSRSFRGRLWSALGGCTHGA